MGSTADSKINGKSNCPDAKTSIPLLHRLLNFTVAYFWVGPLVTVYWCNSWHIPENYLFPKDPVTSSWISGAIGYTILFLGYFFQGTLSDFAVRQSKFVQCVVMQFHTYVLCWGGVHQWRCAWVLLDVYTGACLLKALLTLVGASALLFVFRAHRTTTCAPSTISMDLPVKEHFKMPTFFEITSGTWYRAADSLFTTVIVDTVAMVFWRGLWEVMDFSLSPQDKNLSGAWSLVISYSLAFALFLTQGLVKNISINIEENHWMVSLMFEDFITFLHSTVTVSHWRGYWSLMDFYLPYKPLSHWLCHIASFVLLAVGLTAKSIPIMGLARDGRVKKGEGLVYDHFYFTHLHELWTLT